MPEFDLRDPSSPFQGVLQRHNAGLDRLRMWRGSFRDHADALADYLLTYPFEARWVPFFRGRRGQIRDAFRFDSRYQGDARAFAPWDGRWAGTWNGVGSTSPQHHVWDVTQAVGDQQVQPVTQSTSFEVNRGNLAAASTPAAGGTQARVDLGINVWRAGDGITGWVSKRQDERPLELPHVGYLLNPHALIWITQPGFSGMFHMFFEWADPPTNRYGIHGRTFQLNGTRFEPVGLSGWTVYHRVA